MFDKVGVEMQMLSPISAWCYFGYEDHGVTLNLCCAGSRVASNLE